MVGLGAASVQAVTMAERTKGFILLQVESHFESWYVSPVDLRRYPMFSPSDLGVIVKKFGLGITDANLAKIPVAGSTATGDLALRARVSGRFLLQVQSQFEIWYVYPRTKQRYHVGNLATGDYTGGYNTLRKLGLGITNANLRLIPVDVGLAQTRKSISTARGLFTVNYLSFNRTNPLIVITTDTGQTTDCHNGCAVYSLGTYVERRHGVAGIHGTYFCPAEYPSCSGQTNSYLYPVYNSYSRVMVNNARIKYTTQPMVAFDLANTPYYFHQAKDFINQATFEANYGVKLRAAISNGPQLVEKGVNVLHPSSLDSKQATVKSYRGALGWKGDTIYLMVVEGATVTDSAAVMTALGLDYAINLDGGGSTAMFNASHYVLGPGRSLPNAIVLLPTV